MESETTKKLDLKTITFAVYGGWAAGILSSAIHFLGILPLIAVIVAFIKRKEAGGTIYESHLTWVVRTFVIGVISAIGAMVLMIIPPIGMLGMGAVVLWSLYRMVKGGLKLLENKPIDDPNAWV